MSVQSNSTELIQEMVRCIVQLFDPEQMILFGSHARGTAGPDSDVDLLVVMNLQGDRRATRLAIRRVLSGRGMPKDIVVVTHDFSSIRKSPGSASISSRC